MREKYEGWDYWNGSEIENMRKEEIKTVSGIGRRGSKNSEFLGGIEYSADYIRLYHTFHACKSCSRCDLELGYSRTTKQFNKFWNKWFVTEVAHIRERNFRKCKDFKVIRKENLDEEPEIKKNGVYVSCRRLKTDAKNIDYLRLQEIEEQIFTNFREDAPDHFPNDITLYNDGGIVRIELTSLVD